MNVELASMRTVVVPLPPTGIVSASTEPNVKSGISVKVAVTVFDWSITTVVELAVGLATRPLQPLKR